MTELFNPYTTHGPNQVVLTEEAAVKLVFQVLNLSCPSKEQQQFALREIQSVQRQKKFMRLMFMLTGFMGNADLYLKPYVFASRAGA